MSYFKFDNQLFNLENTHIKLGNNECTLSFCGQQCVVNGNTHGPDLAALTDYYNSRPIIKYRQQRI